MKIRKNNLFVTYLLFSGALLMEKISLILSAFPLMGIIKINSVRLSGGVWIYLAAFIFILSAVMSSHNAQDFFIFLSYLIVALSLRNKFIFLHSKYLVFFVAASVLIALMIKYDVQSDAKDGLSIRLRSFTPEASYFGTFMVVFAFQMFSRLNYQAGTAFVFLGALSQSYYAVAVMIFLFLIKKYRIIIYFVSLMSALFFVKKAIDHDYTFFLLNSGLIRLSGLLILAQCSYLDLLFGLGLGASNLVLPDIINMGHFSTLPSFVFGHIADIGIIGFAAQSLITVRTKNEFFIFMLFLMNFPPLLPFVPIMLAILRSVKPQELIRSV